MKIWKNSRASLYNLVLIISVICFVLTACSVPISYKVKKAEIPILGKPLPLLTNIYVDSNGTYFSGQFEYSKTGDYKTKRIRDKKTGKRKRTTVWNVHTDSISFSYKDFFLKVVKESVQKGFQKKTSNLNPEDDRRVFALDISLKEVTHNVKHKAIFSGTIRGRGRGEKVPTNIYEVTVKGELQYKFVDPDGQIIIEGTTTGEGVGKGRQVGLIFSGDTGAQGAFKGAYESAFEAAIYEASMRLVNELLTRREVAEVVHKVKLAKTLPANLTTKVQYSDNNSLIPNNTIDAKEESRITVSVTNEGKGTAFDLKVKTDTDYRNIDFPESVSIGDIQPGGTKDVTINLKAGLDLASGKAPFTIYAAEKRGYDSRKVKVFIPTARLEKPDLVFVDYRIDDGNTGLAQGNGNGIAESGETIELTAFIKNRGHGKAIGVNMSAAEINTGIKWVRDEMAVGIIPSGRTVKAKVAFAIPRNFDAGGIRSLLKVSDIRGVSSAEKKVALAYSKESPELQYAYRILSRGKEVSSVINGEQYEVELTVNNRGKLPARNVVTSITPYKDIQIDRRSLKMGEIKAGSSHPVQRITFYVPRTFMESSVSLNIEIEQTDFGKSEGVIEIPVHIKSPKLSYAANLLGKGGGNIIEKGESAILEIHVVNEGSLPAEAVALSIESTDENMSIIGKKNYVLGRIPAKLRSETVKFQISTKRRINTGDKYLKINIVQKDFPSVSSGYALNITEEDLRIIDLAAEDSKKSSVTGVPASNLAPSINILSPQSGETVDDEKVYLALDVADFKSIESVRVEVNGLIMPIRDNAGGSRSLRERKIRTDIPLKEGGNRIVVYAYNSDNVLTKREIVISRRSEEDIDTPLVTNIKNPDAIAVVIGISRYENPDIPTVDYARRDAEIMKKYLVRTLGFKEKNIFERYDSKASFGKLRAIFKRKLGNRIIPGKSDVFIFYSGHGVPGIEDKQPYLAPYDFDPEAIEDTGYNLNDFYKQISKLKARNVTIVLDACFSGSSEKGMVIKGISPVFLEVDNPVMKVKNSVVFTSSTGRQVSSWYYKKRHGLFTYYFLMGLRGAADADKDGQITAGEMEKYLTAIVPKQARSLRSREQTPQVFGDKKRVLLNY